MLARTTSTGGTSSRRRTGQLAQVQLEPQLQEPEVAQPQSPMMKYMWLMEVGYCSFAVAVDVKEVLTRRKRAQTLERWANYL